MYADLASTADYYAMTVAGRVAEVSRLPILAHGQQPDYLMPRGPDGQMKRLPDYRDIHPPAWSRPDVLKRASNFDTSELAIVYHTGADAEADAMDQEADDESDDESDDEAAPPARTQPALCALQAMFGGT